MSPTRFQKTMSLLQFHKNTQTSKIPIPPQVLKINKNALKPYSTVWEKTCDLTPDTLNRMKPWSPGPTVKRHSSHWIPANQMQAAIPSPSSKEKLEKLRELNGLKEKSERHTLPPFKIASFLTNKNKLISMREENWRNRSSHQPPPLPKKTKTDSTPGWWPKQPLPWDEAGRNGGLESKELRYRILSWKKNVEKQELLLKSKD